MFITKPTIIELDKKRRLRFTIGSIVSIEEKLGTSINHLPEWSEVTPRQLRTLLWGGLLQEDPSLTEEAVGEISNLPDFPQIIRKLGEALVAAYSLKKEVKSPQARPQLLAAA